MPGRLAFALGYARGRGHRGLQPETRAAPVAQRRGPGLAAEGLDEGSLLHTFEINDEQEDFTRPWLEQSPYADKIKFYIGDALERVPQLGITFDLVFVDGDKRKYMEYYEMSLAHLSPGGYIIADNTLWDGHVTETPNPNDAQTIGIQAFNEFVAKDNRVEKVILPLRDGLTIIRKKNE